MFKLIDGSKTFSNSKSNGLVVWLLRGRKGLMEPRKDSVVVDSVGPRLVSIELRVGLTTMYSQFSSSTAREIAAALVAAAEKAEAQS